MITEGPKLGLSQALGFIIGGALSRPTVNDYGGAGPRTRGFIIRGVIMGVGASRVVPP